jgi:adenylosuccinate synthase
MLSLATSERQESNEFVGCSRRSVRGKGKIAAYLTQREDIDICVRCGGPNSGHSFYDVEGRFRVLRQLPTGFINPRTRLLIPAGALIDPGVLASEMALVPDAEKRIGIDRNTFTLKKTWTGKSG